MDCDEIQSTPNRQEPSCIPGLGYAGLGPRKCGMTFLRVIRRGLLLAVIIEAGLSTPHQRFRAILPNNNQDSSRRRLVGLLGLYLRKYGKGVGIF
jgi:hypothetical protein